MHGRAMHGVIMVGGRVLSGAWSHARMRHARVEMVGVRVLSGGPTPVPHSYLSLTRSSTGRKISWWRSAAARLRTGRHSRLGEKNTAEDPSLPVHRPPTSSATAGNTYFEVLSIQYIATCTLCVRCVDRCPAFSPFFWLGGGWRGLGFTRWPAPLHRQIVHNLGGIGVVGTFLPEAATDQVEHIPPHRSELVGLNRTDTEHRLDVGQRVPKAEMTSVHPARGGGRGFRVGQLG